MLFWAWGCPRTIKLSLSSLYFDAIHKLHNCLLCLCFTWGDSHDGIIAVYKCWKGGCWPLNKATLTALREVHRQPRGTTTSSGLPITLLVERQREVHISPRGTHPDDQSDLLRVISFLLYSRNTWRVGRGMGSLISRPYSLCFFTLRHLYSMWYLSGELTWGLGWKFWGCLPLVATQNHKW